MANKSVKLSSMGIAATLVAGLAVGPAGAQTEIKLTMIDGYPLRSMWVTELSKFFIPEVNKRLAKDGKYKIKWNEAYGGQIVKPRGVLEGIEKGLGDIGVVTTVFHASKVPLQLITYQAPFVSLDPVGMGKAVDALANKFPAFRKAFEKRNQIYLTSGCVLDSYQVYSKSAIKSPKDLKGVKLAGAGANLRYFDGMGVVGVKGSLVKYYNNLKTGVVDAAVIWPEAAKTFKIGEVAPHMLQADIGTVCSKAVTVNKDTWGKLPAAVQQALKETAVAYRDRIAGVALKRAAASMDWFNKNGGKVVKLPAAERLAWAKSMPNIAKGWAARLEKKGVPGKKILAAYMDLMREGGAKPLRDWDKE
jgi:C4-dicarboxylate-binding protein DctP